ncbi:MAE_28990/MAE_18760 family HEPN-like nuclease [Pseudomonas sp. 3JA]|uniref:MAE_28990/MAE_18760 family HEPN-like nuclease n=1 Tax=Pseudomonas sp. 3JA TaxID=3109347 RepID=UPI00300A1C3E
MDEYNKRKTEVTSYLNLVSFLNGDNIEIKNDDNSIYIVTSVETTTLKASFFLVLYNIVEATVREGIRSIYNAINDQGLSFSKLNDRLQEIWWHSHHESISSTPRDALIRRVYEVYCLCKTETSPEFRDFIAGISGNLDADGVRSVCQKYGIEPVADGRDLKSVKNNRNWLAHGNKSFSEVGKDATPSELQESMARVFSFLDEYVNNITSYIEKGSFASGK